MQLSSSLCPFCLASARSLALWNSLALPFSLRLFLAHSGSLTSYLLTCTGFLNVIIVIVVIVAIVVIEVIVVIVDVLVIVVIVVIVSM